MDVNIQHQKIELIQWLTTLDDESLVQKLIEIRNSVTSDWWSTISNDEKKSIIEGLKNLAQKIEKITRLISLNPNVFPDSTIKKGVKRAVLDKFNTIYYRLNGETVEILSFFANRKNPDTLNLDN